MHLKKNTPLTLNVGTWNYHKMDPDNPSLVNQTFKGPLIK